MCPQELTGVLKLLEKQIRSVEKCQVAGDVEGFVNGIDEAVASHNTAAAQCNAIAQMETADLPDLLLQQSMSIHKRASSDMVSSDIPGTKNVLLAFRIVCARGIELDELLLSLRQTN